MKEINEIIQAFDKAEMENKKTALATVVHVEGSSYRRPGARMLITEEGEVTGAISGGCLEGDALRKALLTIMEQQAKLVTYDTNDEDDAQLGLGLGCNGIIQVLIEPIDPNNPNNPIRLLKRVVAKRQYASLISLFSLQEKRKPQHGTCMVVTREGTVQGNAPVLEEVLLSDAKGVMTSKQSAFKNYICQDKSITAFVEYLKPPVSLVIIGAGNDVLPLVRLAEIMGWTTTVVDSRPFYSKQDKFLAACQILTIRPEDLLKQVTIDDQTVFVLMTHNYNYDMSMLRVLIQQDLPYIGMLGPKKKLTRMLDELCNGGMHITQQQLSTIHSPTGLDIGAETPEEIALSITAEIKAILSKRHPVPLKENNDVIHSRAETVIETVKIHSHL